MFSEGPLVTSYEAMIIVDNFWWFWFSLCFHFHYILNTALYWVNYTCMWPSQVESKHYFITHCGCVTTFHVLWYIVLFHVAWECDCVVQNFCWGWGSYLQRDRNSNECCFSKVHCGMFSCTFITAFFVSQQVHLLPSPLLLHPPWNHTQVTWSQLSVLIVESGVYKDWGRNEQKCVLYLL